SDDVVWPSVTSTIPKTIKTRKYIRRIVEPPSSLDKPEAPFVIPLATLATSLRTKPASNAPKATTSIERIILSVLVLLPDNPIFMWDSTRWWISHTNPTENPRDMAITYDSFTVFGLCLFVESLLLFPKNIQLDCGQDKDQYFTSQNDAGKIK